MSGLVLVDSSAWIAAGRADGDPEIAAKVGTLMKTGLAAMTEPVWVELYQGIRGKPEEARLQQTRSLCVWLEFDADCWTVAAGNARICLRMGVNVPFGDLLVDACASRYGAGLLECDRHFAMIADALKK